LYYHKTEHLAAAVAAVAMTFKMARLAAAVVVLLLAQVVETLVVVVALLLKCPMEQVDH